MYLQPAQLLGHECTAAVLLLSRNCRTAAQLSEVDSPAAGQGRHDNPVL
jgi:hypothetical protein